MEDNKNEHMKAEEALKEIIKASLILTLGPEGGYPESMRKKFVEVEKIEE